MSQKPTILTGFVWTFKATLSHLSKFYMKGFTFVSIVLLLLNSLYFTNENAAVGH